MDSFKIQGPARLEGSVKVSKAKNSSLPIIAASLLCKNPIAISNLPKLRDVKTIKELLMSFGVKIDGDYIDTSGINNTYAAYDLVRKMRASILVLGPLLSRYGEARVSLPGGCAIGTRPVDLHILGLKKMGAEIIVESGYINAKATRLQGAEINLAFPSVGATENLLMAAVFAEGETIIQNAAREPEIEDLGNFLLAAFKNLKITGLGSEKITIQGIDQSSDNEQISYTPIADRIEASTLIIAGVMTNSNIVIEDLESGHIRSVLNALKMSHANLKVYDNTVEVLPRNKELSGFNLRTMPYPYFPTDVQAQFMALATMINDTSILSEEIFENRFMHVAELNRMGADIRLNDQTAVIVGGKKLKAAPVMCTDLRASAALVLASMVAEGETSIHRVYHLDRGYDCFEDKLSGLGCSIKRVRQSAEARL